MLGIVGALLIGGAVFYLFFKTQITAQSIAAEDRLNIEWGRDEEESFRPPIYMKITKPLLQGAPLSIASGMWSEKALDKWKVKLTSAGLNRHIEAEHFVASKFWLMAITAILTVLNFLFSESPPPAWLPVVATISAFFYPNIDISSTISRRQQKIRESMPFVVDLLTLSVEAGLDFLGAISKVVEQAPHSPLIEELSTLLKDIQLGNTRSTALKDMAKRINMLEISSFTAVLISSDQMGASIGAALRGQSDSMRNERLTRAEKLGAQASQKILIPLVIFILPAVMLMIFGPIVIGMVN